MIKKRIGDLLIWLKRNIPHDHKWEVFDNNKFKRRCSTCGRVEWMFQSPFPSSDRPGLRWEFMYYVD